MPTTDLPVDVDKILRSLAACSPSLQQLIEEHANRLIGEYIAHKQRQGVVIGLTTQTTIPLHSHGIFIIELNRHQLLELGIMPEVMEKMFACFSQKLELENIKVSDEKPMPAYREWAYTKLISGKFHAVETYDETTHIIINF